MEPYEQLKLKLWASQVPDELVRFGAALDRAYAGTWDGWAYFLERPAKWGHEYALWTQFGKPGEDDDGWADFVDGVLEIELA